MENRQNLVEHQIYATIQRKQPPMPPFGAANHQRMQPLGNTCNKGGNFTGTLDRLKFLRPRREEQGIGGVDLVPQTSADICPYATSVSNTPNNHHRFHHLHYNNLMANGESSRCATLGRIKTLEMTEYQKDKLLNEANTVRIKVS